MHRCEDMVHETWNVRNVQVFNMFIWKTADEH